MRECSGMTPEAPRHGVVEFKPMDGRRGWVAVGVIAATLASASAALGAERAAGHPKATLATFAGRWTGHTRSLRVHRDGHATESIYSGCCDPVLNLTLLLSRPTGTPTDASVRVRVTGVWIRDKSAFNARHPAPHEGELGTLHLKHAVIYEPFTGTNYCSAGGSKCGA